jgi:hypothetical protein
MGNSFLGLELCHLQDKDSPSHFHHIARFEIDAGDLENRTDRNVCATIFCKDFDILVGQTFLSVRFSTGC